MSPRPHFSRHTRSLFTPSLAAVLLSGCSTGVDIGDDAHLQCERDADCPSPMTCQEDARRCALPGVVYDTAAPQLTGATSSAAVIGAADTASITITATEPLADAVVHVEGDTSPLVVTIDDRTISCEVAAAGRAAGPVLLVVTAVDAAGNERKDTRLDPGLAIDPDAPDVRADEVHIRPGPDNVLFPGTADAARADSTVLLEIDWNEAPASVGAVEAVDDTGATIPLDVEVLAESAVASSFVLAAAELALLGDGQLTISVEVTDPVGNQARRTLATPLVVDTTPPPSPTLDLLVRAPFGDDRPAPHSHAEGSAEDALLVLAVPADIVVDPARVPPHVARAAVDAGSFVVDVGIDVPGLRIVAVDAAGNLSVPAAAHRTALVASTVLPASPHELHARPVVSAHLLQTGDVRADQALRDDGEVRTSAAVFWRPLTTVRQDPLPAPPIVAADPVAGGLLAVANGFTFRVREGQVQQLDVPQLPIRRGGALATDSRRGRVVLFGGKDAAGKVRNDLFEWDGTAWRTVLAHAPADDTRPSPREGHGMTFVPALGGVVVVGGCGGDDDPVPFLGCRAPLPLEVWRWDGASFAALCSGAACGTGPLPLRPELTVDASGALVAAGGLDNSTSSLVLIGAPRVFRFADNTFSGSCADACAEAMPFDLVAIFDAERQLPAFLGTCAGGPCVVHVDGESAQAASLDGPVPLGDDPFQQRGVAVDDARVVLVTGSFPGTVSAVDRAAGDGAAVGQLAPRRLQARCGGAAAVIDGDVRVLGGCQACEMDETQGWCGQPLQTSEAPAAVRLARADTPVSGSAFAVPLDTDTLIVSRVFAGAGGIDGSAALRLASDVDTALPDLPLGERRYAVGGFSAGGADTLLVQAVSNPFDFPPSYGVVEPVLRVAADGSATNACGAGCSLNFSDGRGAMIARTRGQRGVLFGGAVGDGFSTGQTVLLDEDGQGTLLAPSRRPHDRAHGNLVYDAERDATWLFGGSAGVPGINSHDCGVPGGPAECADLWLFDGDDWRQVTPVDITGFGAPPPRAFAQAASAGGGLVVSGGAGSSFGPSPAHDDAWQLVASTTQAMSHHLRASYANYGPDARQGFDGLAVRWCGSATDASGAPAAVGVRVWAGGRWLDAAVVVDGDCVDATLPAAGIEELVVVDGRVAVEVLPLLASAGPNDAALTTTALTLTTFFAPPAASSP